MVAVSPSPLIFLQSLSDYWNSYITILNLIYLMDLMSYSFTWLILHVYFAQLI